MPSSPVSLGGVPGGLGAHNPGRLEASRLLVQATRCSTVLSPALLEKPLAETEGPPSSVLRHHFHFRECKRPSDEVIGDQYVVIGQVSMYDVQPQQ